MADTNEDDLYAATDWLLAHQDTIQKKLAARQPSGGPLVLYNLLSSYFGGTTTRPFAKLGYSRDGRKGMLQVDYHRCARLPGGHVGVRGRYWRQRDPDARDQAAA
ncbi:hypothetical protein SBBP2_1530021 [Burkholderiales bacterium]|nr:hypothetical protein SBBP2_1530021 [Burkholderiales bacterium]